MARLVFVALAILQATASCARKPALSPADSASATPTPIALTTETASCIDEKQVVDMFDEIRHKGQWAINGPMLWGYYFLDGDQARLEKARDALVQQGYRFVEIMAAEQAGESLILHVERVEAHSVQSLNARNRELCAFAAARGLQSYDGMDVGLAPPTEPH